MMASVALVAVEESVAVMAVVDSELYLRLAGNKIFVSAELIQASGTFLSTRNRLVKHLGTATRKEEESLERHRKGQNIGDISLRKSAKKEARNRKKERIRKDCLSSDCSLQLGNMKLESLVIADQHASFAAISEWLLRIRKSKEVLCSNQPGPSSATSSTIIQELEGLLIACESEALDHTNSLWTTSPTRRDILEAKKAVKTLLRFQSQFRKADRLIGLTRGLNRSAIVTALPAQVIIPSPGSLPTSQLLFYSEEGSDDRNVVKEDEEPTTYALALYLPYPPPSLLGMRKEEGDVRISSNWRNWNWKKLPLALLPLMLKSLPVLIVQSSKLKRPAVVAVVKKTFEEGRIPDNMNNILITLIPKQEKPATLAQCRPIPLCNVIYKVIAKVAVSRLRPCWRNFSLQTKIASSQGGAPLRIVQELLHTMRRMKGKKGGMAIKVDLEKAYDRVRCDFLHSVLVERGFSNKWVSPLMSCVTASSLSVLWNGERTAAFTLGRGLIWKRLKPARWGPPILFRVQRLKVENRSSNLSGLTLRKAWTKKFHLLIAKKVMIDLDSRPIVG
ncbi:UNVERIFIED_CONTAM: hypothetical protein Scaly_2739000 [Sesamum calycinum]|uniref:Reverse transcriptase domain-containing protein n=1 Tax=Sesamum calycinum TaxID=2727403 RepID=A0AAW2J0W2_9LAMI